MRVVPDACISLPLSPAAALQESEIHGKQLEDSASSLRQKASEVYFYSIQYVSSVAGATLLQLFGTVKVHLSHIAHPDPLFPQLQVDRLNQQVGRLQEDVREAQEQTAQEKRVFNETIQRKEADFKVQLSFLFSRCLLFSSVFPGTRNKTLPVVLLDLLCARFSRVGVIHSDVLEQSAPPPGGLFRPALRSWPAEDKSSEAAC